MNDKSLSNVYEKKATRFIILSFLGCWFSFHIFCVVLSPSTFIMIMTIPFGVFFVKWYLSQCAAAALAIFHIKNLRQQFYYLH